MSSDGVSRVPDTTELRQEVEFAARALWATRTSESFDERRAEFPDSVDIARARADALAILSASGLLAERDKLQAENQQLRSAVEAAQRLHRQNTGRINVCVHCQGTWPCATTRALAAVVVGEPEAEKEQTNAQR